MELQAIFVEYNKELEKKQKELTDPIFEKVMAIVKRIATTRELSTSSSTRRPSRTCARDLDLTDKCIQMYNSGAGGRSPTPTRLARASNVIRAPRSRRARSTSLRAEHGGALRSVAR